MKYLTTIMFIFILNSLYAQQKEVLSEPLQVKKNSIYTYYGFLTYQQFFVIAGSVYQSIFTSSKYDSVNQSFKMPGTFGVGYYRVLNKRIAVGIDCSYTNTRIFRSSKNDLSINETSKVNFYDIGFLLNINYFQRKITTLYGGLIVGSSIINEHTIDNTSLSESKEMIIRPNWHLNLIGVDVGKRVSGFIELGIGHKGLLNAGVRTGF